MWVGVEFYTILMKWCKNWCGLEMLLLMVVAITLLIIILKLMVIIIATHASLQ